ncbi:hypothetical protein SAMN05421760_10971 [Neptunomonas antarctica]|uniref:Uncharacterized protein n=1 Tax=Neptunomonas antarctica TaxID=619304 RepID=A0A1N7NF07_9GAMM|nr:hypothetical protein SAMN05421760_10971 [Neptunomonas antarctica]
MSTCCGSCGGQDAEDIKQQEQDDAVEPQEEKSEE